MGSARLNRASQARGAYSRADLQTLNSLRVGTPVGVDEITRLFEGNLSTVLAWFAPKPMPDGWAALLTQQFSAPEHLVVAFGYPSSGPDFFAVHDSAMRAVVECSLPDDRVVLAST